jgi:PTH1 family peptidyl-tRNA hydrolase
MIKLIVGLGNVGKKYENTRHNVGFMLIHYLIDKFKVIDETTKFQSKIYKIEGKDFSSKINFAVSNNIYFQMPHTLMNNSGDAVQSFCHFHKILEDEVLVIHDDLDLAFAKVKVKQAGGNAGHNGLKDIDAKLGKNYFRIRIGIGKPLDKNDTSNFVLQNFSLAERKALDELFAKFFDSELKNSLQAIDKGVNYGF